MADPRNPNPPDVTRRPGGVSQAGMDMLQTYAPAPMDDARTLDQVYAEKESDIRWRASMLAESPTNQLAETGAGAATPEQVGAIPVPRGTPKQPSAFAAGAQAAMRTAAEAAKSAVSALLLPPGTPEQPSALGVGAQAAMRTTAEAAKSTMEGLGKAFLPGVTPGGVAETEVAKAGTRGPVAQMAGEVVGGLADKVAGVKQALMEGVLSLGMAPFVGLGAGAGQALENANPELAATEVMDPFQASFVRMMTGQGNPLDRDESPEGQARRAALHQPMTLREAVDLAVTTSPIWVPVAIGAGKAVVRTGAKALREQRANILSERGSIASVGGPPGSEPGYLPKLIDAMTKKVDGLKRDLEKANAAYAEAEAKGASARDLQEYFNRIEDAGEALNKNQRLLERHIALRDYEAIRTKKGATPEEVAAARDQLAEVDADIEGAGETVPRYQSIGAGAPSTSRLNVGRVNAPERVKALLTELNEAAGRTLEEHRRPITHEQTVAEGRALSLDQIMLADPALTSIEGGRAVQQGLRDYLNATANKLDALIKAGDDPEAVADLTGLGIYLARLDERFGAGFARGLEARKILSEAVTPGGGEAPTKAPARERTVAGGLTPSNLTYLGETVGLDPVTLGQQAAQQAARDATMAGGPTVAQTTATRAATIAERAAKAGLKPTDTVNVADLVAGKVTGEIALTRVAAELMNTAYGGRPPAEMPVAEVLAWKIAAEQMPRDAAAAPSPEAVLATVKAIQKSIEAAEDAQIRARDEATATIANALAAGGKPSALPEATIADMIAARMTAAQIVDQAAKQGPAPSPEAVLAITRAVEKAGQAAADATIRAQDALSAEVANLRAAAGLPTHAPRTTSVAELVMASMRAQLDRAVSPEALLGALRALTKPQRMTWMQSVAAVGTASRDLLHLLYINAFLSDPTTSHASNVIGTGMMLPWHLATRQIAGIIHAFTSNDPAGVQLGEAMAMVRSIARGSQKGIEMAAARMRDGLQPFEHASEHGPISVEKYGFDPSNGLGKFFGTVGASLEGPMAPVTLMGAEDAYFKGLNAYMEIGALALRNAMRENPTGTPAQIQAAEAKLAAVPTAEMWAEAKKQANIRTLNNELGPAGQAIANAIDKIPLGRWVIPFKRTPMNAASWFSSNTVFLQLMSAKLYKDIFAGSAADREMALARVALGTGVGLAIASLVHQGVITGDGITDAIRRRFRQFTDWPVNTIEVIDGKRYSYDRLDPVAGMVGAIATFEEMRANIPPDQAWLDWMGAHIGVLSLAAGSVFVSKTYMQTLSNLLDDLKHPENFGSKFQQGLARSIVPTVVRHGATAYGGNVVRSVNSMLDAIKSGIPFYRDGIPPDRHPLTGQPIVYPPGLGGEFIQAIKVYSPTGDPVVAQLDENKVRLTPVPWYVAGRASRSGPRLEEPSVDEGVRLLPEERDRWGELVGTTTAGGDKTLYTMMKETVTSDEYAKWPPALREKTLNRIYTDFRKAALAQLEEESQGKPDGILARVTAQMVKRGELLTVNETPMPVGPSRPPAARAAPVPAGAGAPTPAPAATLSPIPPPDLLKSLGR